MKTEHNFLKLAGCIITDKQGRILLLHRNTDTWQHWEVPGGKVEEGEEPKTTAIREAKEELGVNVEIKKLLGQRAFAEKDYMLHYTWYQARIVKGKVKITEPEIFDNYKYFALDDLHSVTLSTGAQAFLAMLEAGEVSIK